MKERFLLTAVILIGVLTSSLAQEQIAAPDQEQSSMTSPPPARAWVARYHDGKNKSDRARALAVDDSGNVFVAGSSADSNGIADYITIKYDNAGVKQWVRRYDGAAKLSDVVSAMKMDAAGNIYVTGTSKNADQTTDVATIKYNPNGARQWIAYHQWRGNGYDDARALAVDDSDNVYVTGESGGICTCKLNYLTIKYSPAGVKQWQRIYDGPEHLYDRPNAMVVDQAGNVYLTGSSQDSTNTTYYATVKYNRAGERKWAVRYKGPGSVNHAQSLAVDGNGNVYVAGYSSGLSSGNDYVTIKYNGNGATQWVVRYNGPGNGDDYVAALVLDQLGNIFVTGSSMNVSANPDYATIKYVQTGVSLSFVPIALEEAPPSERTQILPNDFDLLQNYPNPFNPGTTIRFDLPTAGKIKLAIYNLRGELVRTPVDGEMPAGYYHISFEANDLASGIYFYRMEAGTYMMTRKMILQK